LFAFSAQSLFGHQRFVPLGSLTEPYWGKPRR
jgi:hypothetical protein